MSRVKGKDTRPELRVRRFLHAAGFRFRIHRKDLPGKPDLVLPKYKTVVFVHGCFWHGHAGCKRSALPATRRDFWENKITGNVERDEKAVAALHRAGWRVIIIWECELKPAVVEGTLSALKNRLPHQTTLEAVE